MGGEDVSRNNQEQLQNIGAGALESMPSFGEHMEGRGFRELKPDERPEGVRDEQDYKEMLDEQNKKLAEQQSFIDKYYVDHTSETEDAEMIELINSKELKTITKYNFTLADLANKGIISKTDKWTNGDRYPYYWKQGNIKMISSDAQLMIEELGSMLEWREEEDCPAGDAPTFAKRMHEIFNKWDEPEKLTAEDYKYIIAEAGAESPLGRRLLFGNPEVNYPNEDESDLSVMSHTIRLLEVINGSTADYSDELLVAEDVINSSAISDRHKGMAKRALGVVGHTHLDDLLKPDKDATKLALKCMSRQDVLDVKNWQDSFADENLPIFTDTELLGAIYDLEGSRNEEKYYWQREPGRYLAQNIDRLEKGGFSKESLIQVIHDNGIVLSEEEVREMERNGASDVEIAYAGRAYEYLSFDEYDMPVWSNGAFSKLDDGDVLRAVIKARERGEKI